MADSKDSGGLVVINIPGAGAAIPVVINGKQIKVPRDRDVRVRKEFYEVLRESSYNVTLIDGGKDVEQAEPEELSIISVTGGAVGASTDGSATTIEAKDAERGPQGITGTQRADLTHGGGEGENEQDPSSVDLDADGGDGGDAGAPVAGNDAAADKMIEGTVDDVTQRLSGVESTEELDRIRAAETDREKPRSGVMAAIDARAKELSAE